MTKPIVHAFFHVDGPIEEPGAAPPLTLAAAPAADQMVRKRPSVAAPAPKKAHIAGGDAAYRKAREAYQTAHDAFVTKELTPYWREVTAKAEAREGRLIASYTDADFVNRLPPKYTGPAEPDPADYGLPRPKPEPSTIPVIKDFLAAARANGFAFDTLPPNASPKQFAAFEHAFKRSYAKAALAFGLTPEQILGVYAFETAGNGFHTEQPITKSGRPISTALGYAQLLAANSVNTIAQHGERIAAMLDKDGKHAKADLVRRMRAAILAETDGRVPDVEVEARILGRTPLGRAVHAANLDKDIGPYVQSVKLADIVDHYRAQARANGMPEEPFEPWRLEGMNLAGLSVGFQLDAPALAKRLAMNFFKEDGYEANPVVGRGQTAEGLLKIIRDGMHGAFTKAKGYREMSDLFDELRPKTTVQASKARVKTRGSR